MNSKSRKRLAYLEWRVSVHHNQRLGKNRPKMSRKLWSEYCHLSDMQERENTNRGTRPRYVNVYRTDRAFGGHEEGGWWYDTGVLLWGRKLRRSEMNIFGSRGVKYVTMKPEFKRKMELLVRSEDWFEHLHDSIHSIGSVCCDGVVEVYCEETAGHDFPQERPHYE